MSRKNIVLVDGSSMLRNAFYGLPSNGARGVQSLIVKLLEAKEADYLAVAFDSGPEGSHKEMYKNTAVYEGLLTEEERLREAMLSLDIPVLDKNGYTSADILASLAKRCLEEEGEIQLLSGDRRLLQAVEEHVTLKMPVVREEGLEFKAYSIELIREEFGLEPESLGGVFALSGSRGIGEKMACQLIREYHSVENIYDHIEEIGSQRIREALTGNPEAVKRKEELAALRRDCDIRLDYTKTLQQAEIQKIIDMDFVQAVFPGEDEEPSLESGFQAVTDLSEAEAIFLKCKVDCRLGLQLVIEDKAVSALSLCLSETECYCFIPQGTLTPQYLAEKAEEVCKRAGQTTVFHLKSQLAFLKLSPEQPVFDAGVAGYLLNPLKDSYEYNDLAEDYLDLSTPSRSELIGKSSFKRALEENREKAVTCICYISYVALKSHDLLRESLEKAGMDKLFYEIEMPLIYSLFHMEEAGIRVEKDRLKEYGDRLKVRIAELEQKIYEETGETFNINSPKQLGEVLFDHMKIPGGKKTKTGYSTAADVLEKLAPDWPAVNLILDYRQLTKLNSTYADGLAAYIGPDERIHGTFNQTITATGRISSTEPNLQNIPVRMELGREIRKVFVPQEGCRFVDADYSQIELRVLAHMSGDQRLIGAYRQAEDIHAITASQVFHVPLNEVTPLQRRNAKAVNFGIVYGISSFGLSEGLSITRKEASEYISKYFETYPGVKSFLDGLVSEAKEQGFAVSMFGRRRPVPELKSSNFMQRSFGERVAMNSPIQGTAADIIKIAMIRVDNALRKQELKSRIVLQVHDELLIEAYHDEVDKVKELLVEEMKHAADLAVSLEVEANVGDSWFDAK
ncbi:DNA polymerase I [Lacrimispora celerecrescens]|uniref:DNA polymerase I n=1 Tax=[Clostridium] celerecrescens 18A TaxID=1286362 RepID=A0A2M8Z4C6_9FIRM|nr:DNA polymerase I [Lacrimispora celerecrescens]PJJ28298.1 DNA polymerase I [[Clostridium] celerecrescens 18A]